MKSIFLHFKDPEEKKKFRLECTYVDERRVFIYVSIIAAFELFLLVFDTINSNSSYSAVQWAYRIMNTVMALVSIIIVGVTAWASRNVEKRFNIFRIALDIYSVIILTCAVCDAVTGTISSGRENLTMFFICIMLVSCVFYVNSLIVTVTVLLLFFAFELFTHFTHYSAHHTYAPYPVFIIFITVSVSFIRARQMLLLIRKNKVIKKLHDQAVHENELKSQFLATMSHEIRTPMNAIVGMSELALDFNLNDSEKNAIRQIRSAGVSLVGIINDILDFSKIESGKMEIVPVDYDLVKLMKDIADISKVRLEGKPVGLFLEIEENLPSVYHGDDMRIRQILINLAGNAAKFTEKGFIKIRIEDLKKYEDRQGLRISVIDSGLGIKEEDLQKLFGAFQQVDMNTNRSKGGTGLGLNISKRLMELMGGSIGVTSEYGKGSCFYINLPQKIVDSNPCSKKYKSLFEAAGRDEENALLAVIPVMSLLNRPEFAGLFVEKSESVSFKASNAKILVVDDNEVNLQIAEGLLKKLGVIADSVKSGYEALDKVFENHYDIIFMDHQMPGMDGIETLEKIRRKENSFGQGEGNEKNEHRIVVSLSANAVNGAREMFISKGFDDFLAKPVQGKDFAVCLKKWLPANLIEEIDQSPEGGLVIPKGFPSWNEEKLDLLNAMNNSGGYENYMKTLRTFYLSIEKNAAEIGRFLISEDIKNYTIQVHALKSAARIIGANELSKKAEYLELFCKKLMEEREKLEQKVIDERMTEVHERSTSLIALYASYMRDLRPLVEFYDNSNKVEEAEYDEGAVKEIISSIINACDSCDLDSVENQFALLKKYHFNEEQSLLIKKLGQAIEEIEYKTIIEHCNEFIAIS